VRSFRSGIAVTGFDRPPARRSSHVTGRACALASGFVIVVTLVSGLAPAASAHNVVPNEGGSAPATRTAAPATAATATLPLWVILAIIAGAMLVAAATTVVVLAVDRTHHPHTVAAGPGPEPEMILDLDDPAIEVLEPL